VFETKSDLGDGTEQILSFILRQERGQSHTIGRFRLSATTSPRPVRATMENDPSKEILSIVHVDPTKRTDAQNQKLAAFYRTIAPSLAPIRSEITKLESTKIEFLKGIPRVLVSISDTPKPVRILPRGNWLSDSGDLVDPAVPHFLPQLV